MHRQSMVQVLAKQQQVMADQQKLIKQLITKVEERK